MAYLQMADEESQRALDQGMPGAQKGRLIVKFFMGATHRPDESAKAGRPIFKDEEYVRIIVPGEMDERVRPVRPSDEQEYPREYAAFKNQQAQPSEGTPLTVLPFVTAAQAAELNAINVHTAEQLVGMADVNGAKVMGINALKRRVQAFLDAAANAAPAEALQAELKKRDDEINVLKAALEKMGKKLDERK
jgi:hypothetical protein